MRPSPFVSAIRKGNRKPIAAMCGSLSIVLAFWCLANQTRYVEGKLVSARPTTMSGFGVERWNGSAVSVLVVYAVDGVDGCSEGTVPGNPEADCESELESPNSDCEIRGVDMPL